MRDHRQILNRAVCKRCRKAGGFIKFAAKAKENKKAKPSVGSLGGDPAHICGDKGRASTDLR